MLNLLIISNSPRADLVCAHFQQQLKMRIEVVADFDHGLKDVFEKRPVVVCIQEQIAGVTGESVARHIQLLLGNGAPAFVLLHEGVGKARVIPGLFDHLVDLTATFEMVCQTLSRSLQTLLGDHWEMLYNASAAPVQDKPSPGVSAAEQLVDDFIAETSILHPVHVTPLPEAGAGHVSDFGDLLEHELPGGPPAERHAARIDPIAEQEPETSSAAPPEPSPAVQQQAATSEQSGLQPLPGRPVRQIFPQYEPVQSVSTASTETPEPDEPSVPVEDLLRAFEENYRSKKRVLRLVAGGGVVVSVILLLIYFVGQRKINTPQTNVVKQQVPDIRPEPPKVQSVLSSARQQVASTQPKVKSPPVPAFIPAAGCDHAFSDKHPGWFRYLSKVRDYRLFYQNGQLQAVQVLAVGSASIATGELQGILRELIGKDQFRVDRAAQKQGVFIEHAVVSEQAELLLYRPKPKGPIRAFVFARK